MSLSLILALGGAQVARADAPLLIRAIAPGSQANPAAEYVMAQMSADGQQQMSGVTLTLYGPAGEVTKSYAAVGALAHGEAMRSILFASEAVVAAAGFPAPDFDLGPGGYLDPAAGAACLTGPYPPDCATWGTLPAALAGSLPDPQSLNAAAIAGPALGRSIERGCPSWLGPEDDRGIGAADFYDGVAPLGAIAAEPAPPSPQSNAAIPTESPCEVVTGFNQVPANPTSDTTPTFAYDQVFREYDSTFECSFGSAPFTPCPATGISYGPLQDGVYSFAVYARGHAGSDPTPVSWEWEVDTVPPDTLIDSAPPEPSSGFSASFSFHSTEHDPTFRCRLDEGAIQACAPGKTYFLLADGTHLFRVWSSDQASNADPTPAVRAFDVDTRIGDRTPPNTKIATAPANPSPQAISHFTYTSTEAGSAFECSLDGRPFSPCPPTGIAYGPRRNGRHLFQVRATDRAGNVDEAPATHAWLIRAPLPQTFLTRVPAGISYLKGAKKARISFGLRSSVTKAGFRCRLDKQRFGSCHSPLSLSVGGGRHRFEAYAVDGVGNADPSPVRWIFRVAKRRSKGLF